MTDTTAKVGMVKYKHGYSKDAFEYGYIEDIPYNDKLSIRNLVKGLEAKDKNLELENIELKKQLADNSKLIESMNKKIESLGVTLEEVRTKYYEALKGVITR